MTLRFGFDMGTASLGWAVYELDEKERPVRLKGCGSRIFNDGRDPKSGKANAKLRREPLAMRRRRDRYIQRRRHVMACLIDAGLMPEDERERKKLVQLDPYRLRASALREALPLHHVGRAFFHINQRRGFKSNRKTDLSENNARESGAIADAAKRLKERLEKGGYETLGAFLYERQKHEDVRQRDPVRIRMDADNKQELYEFYPLRQMLEEEFDLICEHQRQFNPDFPSADKIARVKEAIFFQRPLKEVHPGYCSFYPDELRLCRAHPLAQEFVLYQKVNELRFEDDDGYPIPMSLAQRDEMIARVQSGANLTWKQVRKIMGMPGDSGRISLEEGGEKNIAGNPLAARFKGTAKKPGAFARQWDDLSLAQKEEIVRAYQTSAIDEELLKALAPFNLTEEEQQRALKCTLPDGYLHIGERAVRQILPHLRENVMTYSDACKLAGLHHSDKRDGKLFDRLPYDNMIEEMKRHLGHGTGDPDDPRDKRYGRIANPTVHIGLNQLHRVVNALIDKYGRPDEVVVELSRELKMGKAKKDEERKKRDTNRKAQDVRREELQKLDLYQPGDRKRIGEALMRMRLWEELAKNTAERCCPYSGQQISINNLFSDEVEIEHILPRSKTLDDSPSNKTVAFRSWNRKKRNLSPAEAAEKYPDMFSLEDIIARTRTMPHNKRWRFLPDAMKRYNDEKVFENRQLNETQYLAKVARHYLTKLHSSRPDSVDPETGEIREMPVDVWVTTGRLTAELRRKWGLHLGTNTKNRNDHRHHALDACVIGVIDRSLIRKIATAAARDENNEGVDRVLAHIDEPYPGYRDEVNAKLRKVIVSHRPDHRTSGQLHEDTAFGLVRDNENNKRLGELDIGNVVVRRPVSSLTFKQISQVRDLKIRAQLEQILDEVKGEFSGKKEQEKQLALRLAEWSKQTGTRRVRTLEKNNSVVPIGYTPDGKRYKYVVPGENHHMDIVETPDGVWRGVARSVFAANQKEGGEDWRAIYPDARFVMRLHKGDMIQLFDADGVNRIKKIVRINPSANRLFLAEHQEAGVLQKRHDDKDDPFRWDLATISKLKERRARRVRIDQTGRVRIVPHGKE